jgi:hypothetical protein
MKINCFAPAPKEAIDFLHIRQLADMGQMKNRSEAELDEVKIKLGTKTDNHLKI